MVLLKAQRLQQLAQKLGEIEEQLEREGGELKELRRGLEDAAARAGVELQTARRLDAATLARALSPGGRPDPGRFWAVAEALYLDGLGALARGEDAAAASRLEKARALYGRAAGAALELPDGAPTPEERAARIGDVLGDGPCSEG